MTIEESHNDGRANTGNDSEKQKGTQADADNMTSHDNVRSHAEWLAKWDEIDRLEMEAGGVFAVPKAWAERRNTQRAHLYNLAKRALRHAFLQANGQDTIGTWGKRYDAYALNVEANLLDGVPFADLRQAFDDGKGRELDGDATHPPKMAAVYSSSALALNTFGPWYRDLSHLVVNRHRGFKTMMLEAQVPHGLRGTPPHLDLRLDADDQVLAIESKCLEYLTPKPAVFRPAYDTIVDQRAQSPWFRHIAVLRENSDHYRYLDAAQLIKHYLGLSYGEPTTSLTLLYLFWEPRNWQDFDAFWQHREEIRAFSDVVAGDRVRFETLSYNELWAEWEQVQMPGWLVGHVQRLKARYSVDL
jgi:hypothetical protein